ncbi:MAG: hypothetical protein H6537_06880 [Bacteroidales bacterium]|nr:hypothetical protein [Bacteroidales bacterium]
MNEQILQDISEFIERISNFNYYYSIEKDCFDSDASFYETLAKKIEKNIVSSYLSLNDNDFNALIYKTLKLVDISESYLNSYKGFVCEGKKINAIGKIELIIKRKSLSKKMLPFFSLKNRNKSIIDKRFRDHEEFKKNLKEYFDEKKYYLEYLTRIIKKYVPNTEKQVTFDEVGNSSLTLKQQLILLDLLGIFEVTKLNENNTKLSVLISSLIGKNAQNIRTSLTYFYKNSSQSPLNNYENPKAVIELLESIGLIELANRAKERYKDSLSKIEQRL